MIEPHHRLGTGYDRILHIKESEYNKDIEGTIQKCISFLKGEL